MKPLLTFMMLVSLTLPLLLPAQPGGSTPTPDYKDIEFAQVSGQTKSLTLDIYLPKGLQTAAPVVVYIHPGGWSSGKKEDVAKYVSNLTNAGFAVVSINYRLSGDTVFPAQIHDCKGAIRWLRANGSRYKLETTNIGVYGHSAGAHLAALLGTTSNRKTATSGAVTLDLEGSVGGNTQFSNTVQAVADFFGPSNLVEFYKVQTEGSGSNLVGCTIPTCTDKAILASPTTYISRASPPTLIMHGTADEIVPYSQSVLLDSLLRAAGATVTFTTVQGANHGFDAAWLKVEIQTAVVNFFSQYLKSSATSVRTNGNCFQVKSIAPNPTPDVVTLHFSQTRRQHVDIHLYSMLGQHLARLVDTEFQAGEHTIPLSLAQYRIRSLVVRIQSGTNIDYRLLQCLD